MKVSVCIGSSCHLKGSRYVVERLQRRIAEEGLGDRVELCGVLCTGMCRKGICVRVDEALFSVSPEDVDDFFEENVRSKV